MDVLRVDGIFEMGRGGESEPAEPKWWKGNQERVVSEEPGRVFLEKNRNEQLCPLRRV